MNQENISLSRQLAIALLIMTALLAQSSSAFGLGKSKAPSSKLPLPTLNKETNRWEKSPLDDGKYPYDAIGSALRHGPSPFLTRVFNADEYEQGILKYMATAKVDRAEATGNIDAKLNNAIDWAYQKMEVSEFETTLFHLQIMLISSMLIFVCLSCRKRMESPRLTTRDWTKSRLR
jgi:hypothetical protein